MELIEIFRAGKHKSANGKVFHITKEDLQGVVDNYNRPYPKFCVNTDFNLTVIAQAITKINHKPIHGLFPVLNRHCPFLRRIFNRKPYHLEYRVIGWKDVPFFNHSANHTIERFHGICGVNRFANVRRIIKKCGNIRPVISQHLATSGYFSCHFCESAVKASKACASVEA